MSVETFDTNCSKLSDGDFILKLNHLADRLEEHPAYKETLPPCIPGPTHFRDYADRLTHTVAAIEQGNKEKEGERAELRAKGEKAITFASQYVVMFSNHSNDAALLENVGLALRHKAYSKGYTGLPEMLTRLSVKNGKVSGTIVAVVNRWPGNGSVELQATNDDPAQEASWTTLGRFYHCRMEVTDLEPVKVYYFRARVHNSSGAGPWSAVVRLVVV